MNFIDTCRNETMTLNNKNRSHPNLRCKGRENHYLRDKGGRQKKCDMSNLPLNPKVNPIDSKKCWTASCQLFSLPCRGQVQVMTKEREYCQILIVQTETIFCILLANTVIAKLPNSSWVFSK